MRPTVGLLLIGLISFSAFGQQKRVVFRTLPTQTTLLVDGKEKGSANNQKIILGFNERKGLVSHEIVITAQGYVDEIITIDQEGPRYLERTIRLERKLPRVFPENEFFIDLEKVVSGLEYSTNVGAQTRWKYRYDEVIDLTAKRSKVIDAFERMGLNSIEPRSKDLFDLDSDSLAVADVLVAGRAMRYDLLKASKGSWSGGYYYTSKARIKWQFYDQHSKEIIHEKEVLSNYEFTTSLINEEFFNSILENFYSLFNNNGELVQELKSYTRPIPQDTIQMAPDTVLADTIVKDTLISLQPGVTPIVFSKVEAPNTGNFSDLVQSAANATVAIMNNSEVQGSGIVVSKDGYIVTNDHFFQDSEDVIIRFSNGITLNAKIMKRAPEHDLSLLKVDVDEISALPINHRTIDVQNGAEVFVLGTTQSQQLEQSVNKGLVTAINDSAEVRSFQTDIRIGLGNSGSPLINMNGEIIGIISEKQISGKPEVSSFAIDALYLRTVLGLTIE